MSCEVIDDIMSEKKRGAEWKRRSQNEEEQIAVKMYVGIGTSLAADDKKDCPPPLLLSPLSHSCSLLSLSLLLRDTSCLEQPEFRLVGRQLRVLNFILLFV